MRNKTGYKDREDKIHNSLKKANGIRNQGFINN